MTDRQVVPGHHFSGILAASSTAAAQDLCVAEPSLQLILLTHATEFLKETNTGALVASAVAEATACSLPPQLSQQLPQQSNSPERAIHVQRLAWSRVTPEPQLLTPTGQWMLLYPTPESLLLDADQADDDCVTEPCLAAAEQNLAVMPDLSKIRGFVVLDATWQLAHKMYRQSPYLQQLPSLMLQSRQRSLYKLRRNQRQQGWCTAESVALLLKALGYSAAATKITNAFIAFNQRPV